MLAEDLVNGKTYTLYQGLFTPIMWIILILAGLLYLVCRDVTRYILTLIIFLWPTIIVLNFLIYGYVVGDQPRLEFALGSLIVSGRVTLDQALRASGYFNWPSTWLLEGIFSNIVRLTPFEAPVYLMIATYFLLGLSLIIVSRNIFHVYNYAIVSLLAYAILNPYKILHFSPQIYAISLLIILLSILLKERSSVGNVITILILSLAIITSHPITSLILAGIMSSMMFFHLVKRESYYTPLLSMAVLIAFISWNLNYENLIKSIIIELLNEQQIQPLPPVAGAKVYEVDTFFKLMALYRYFSLTALSAGSFLAVATLFNKGFLRSRILAIGGGVAIGPILLNFVPGAFFHRALYFASTFMSVLIPITVLLIREKLGVSRFIKISLALLLVLPLSSHIALLEFLTNNNPVATITSPYEMFSATFIAEYYGFRSCVGVPSGALSFYVYMLKINIVNPPCLNLLGGKISLIFTQQYRYNLVDILVRSVYVNEVFMVSPRERFLYYMNTLVNEFLLVDLYLNTDYNLVYNNKVFKVYNTIK